MKYAFIAQHSQEFAITMLCQVLGVSTSGYYAWKERPVSQRQQANAQLSAQIRCLHERSRGTYGSPRIHADLLAMGLRCSRKRVARLMRLAGLRARCRRRYKVTTQADTRQKVAPNLLAQDFSAERINHKWLADITYIATRQGWLYLAAIMDAFSRRIVGWSMSKRLHTRLVENALRFALGHRTVDGDLIHHSDRGSQFTSDDYQALLHEHNIQVSMSASGNCYDNAMMESFFATLKTECVTETYATRQIARHRIFEYIEMWYNRQRRHSALGYLSPLAFEQQHV
jgi:putative transposase